ncbi:sigma factor [Myxococcus sp. AB025B]|uniref:sigma factor n=1 Tax=Myxococcus sp. AB025B TaxID=2562794 RepID=UPI0011414FE3|nr:sigma factor [Myxococcus sp. AB025B]
MSKPSAKYTQRPLTAVEQKLVLTAEKVVWWCVHSFVRRHEAARGFEDDLSTYAWMGAMAAAQRWRPEGGASYRTFAKRHIRRDVARGWLSLVGAVRDEDGRPVAGKYVPLDDVLGATVAPSQERLAEAHRLGATIGERMCQHFRAGLREPTRVKAVQTYLLHLQGDTLEEIGAELGATKQRAHQLLNDAEKAAVRWAASMTPAWERRVA